MGAFPKDKGMKVENEDEKEGEMEKQSPLM